MVYNLGRPVSVILEAVLSYGQYLPGLLAADKLAELEKRSRREYREGGKRAESRH